jgi:hypothetical protein
MAALHTRLQKALSKRQEHERKHLASLRQAAELQAVKAKQAAAAAEQAKLPPNSQAPSSTKGLTP